MANRWIFTYSCAPKNLLVSGYPGARLCLASVLAGFKGGGNVVDDDDRTREEGTSTGEADEPTRPRQVWDGTEQENALKGRGTDPRPKPKPKPDSSESS
jgi:hypothetical protein